MSGRDGQSRTAQDEALDKAKLILGEHFDNIVIIADAPDMEFPDEDAPSLFYRRKGSTWAATGLMEVYREILIHEFMKPPEEP